VISKTAVEGIAFMAGETLYEIGELHALWLRVSVPERDFSQVQLGQRAWVKFSGLDREFTSRVSFIYPHLDAATRRGELRLELKNDDHALRPDMWASVELVVELGRRLAVPASAVIDTGERCVAFVEGVDHHLEPREVMVGARTEDWWEVREGLKEGEQVVTRALFLIDSESQLKAAIAGMGSSAEHKH
jgi:Cu(I)/Ag(I) efflux system membrane fusion protein